MLKIFTNFEKEIILTIVIPQIQNGKGRKQQTAQSVLKTKCSWRENSNGVKA